MLPNCFIKELDINGEKQLCLCTYRIEVGDKNVRHIEGYNRTSDLDWEVICPINDKEVSCKAQDPKNDNLVVSTTLYIKNLFKIIGILCPGAIEINPSKMISLNNNVSFTKE